MPIQYIRPNIPGHIRDPFDCDELAVKALTTIGAFVALADGRVEASERDEAVDYIDGRQVAPTVSRQRIAEFFDERAPAPGRSGRPSWRSNLQREDMAVCVTELVQAASPTTGLSMLPSCQALSSASLPRLTPAPPPRAPNADRQVPRAPNRFLAMPMVTSRGSRGL
jgi:hypothetical protein